MIEENPGKQSEQNDGKGAETTPKPKVEALAGSSITPSVQPGTLPKQPGGEITIKPGEQNEQDAFSAAEKGMGPFERKMVSLTRFAIGVAAITGVIFYVQLRVMTYQTQILAGQVEGDTASASFSATQIQRQLAVAQEQAKAAQDSVEAIRRQMRVSERGRFTITLTFQQSHFVSQPLKASIILVNTGKTELRKIEFFAVVTLVQSGQQLKFTYPKMETSFGGTGIIYPGDTPPQHLTIRMLDAPEKEHLLTKTEVDGLNQSELTQIVYGKIAYWDVFGVHHWNTFCANGATLTSQFISSIAAKECSAYNKTDNDE